MLGPRSGEAREQSPGREFSLILKRFFPILAKHSGDESYFAHHRSRRRLAPADRRASARLCSVCEPLWDQRRFDHSLAQTRPVEIRLCLLLHKADISSLTPQVAQVGGVAMTPAGVITCLMSTPAGAATSVYDPKADITHKLPMDHLLRVLPMSSSGLKIGTKACLMSSSGVLWSGRTHEKPTRNGMVGKARYVPCFAAPHP